MTQLISLMCFSWHVTKDSMEYVVRCNAYTRHVIGTCLKCGNQRFLEILNILREKILGMKNPEISRSVGKWHPCGIGIVSVWCCRYCRVSWLQNAYKKCQTCDLFLMQVVCNTNQVVRWTSVQDQLILRRMVKCGEGVANNVVIGDKKITMWEKM